MKNVSVWWTLLLQQCSAGNCVSKLTYFRVKVDSKAKQKCSSNGYKFYNCRWTFQGFYVTISGENNMKCIGSRLYQTIGKWVINILKEETMSFSPLLSA